MNALHRISKLSHNISVLLEGRVLYGFTRMNASDLKKNQIEFDFTKDRAGKSQKNLFFNGRPFTPPPLLMARLLKDELFLRLP